jgi:uncharacterized repeat protein (TIGR01451 family)
MNPRKYATAAMVTISVSLSAFAQQADLSVDFSAQQNAILCPTPPNGCVSRPIPVAPGGQALFQLILTNNGPAIATNVVATMTFPQKTVLHFSSPLMPCTQSVVGGQPTLTCSPPSISVGGQPFLIAQLDIGADYTSLTLTGTVTVTSGTTDPNLANNSGSATLPVTFPVPTLSLAAMGALAAVLATVALLTVGRS